MGLFTKSPEQRAWEGNQKRLLKDFKDALNKIISSKSYEDMTKDVVSACKNLRDYAWGRLENPDSKQVEKEKNKKTYKGVSLARQLFGKNDTFSTNEVPLYIQRLFLISGSGGLISSLPLTRMGKAADNAIYLMIKNAQETNKKITSLNDTKMKQLEFKKDGKQISGLRADYRVKLLKGISAGMAGSVVRALKKIKPELKKLGIDATVQQVNELFEAPVDHQTE